jgi:hypothetical protein
LEHGSGMRLPLRTTSHVPAWMSSHRDNNVTNRPRHVEMTPVNAQVFLLERVIKVELDT